MRILHLPVAAGRQAWGLSQIEKTLGYESRVVVFEQTAFRLSCDEVLFEANEGIFAQELKRWRLLCRAIMHYDIVHLHFGQKFFTLFPRPFKSGDSPSERLLRLAYWGYSKAIEKFDIWLLKALGKRIFMTFHGDDLRQGDRSLELYRFCIAQDVDDQYYDKYSDNRKRRMAAYYARVCEQIYVVSPDLLDMAPEGAKLVHYTGVNPSEWTAVDEMATKDRPLRIVHAPTHRNAKGSKYIEHAVERLKARGYQFEMIYVEGIPNSEAKEIYRHADIVIDQLLAGWFGVFAVEMMAMGKPVVAYIRDSALAREPDQFQKELPILNADPETIEQVLADILDRAAQNPDEIHLLGEKSRLFVEKWFDPAKAAQPVISAYRG